MRTDTQIDPIPAGRLTDGFRVVVRHRCQQNRRMSQYSMRIIARRTLREFVASLAGHRDQAAVRTALDGWYRAARKAVWREPFDVKAHYRSASILKDRRVVFNICGNSYRLVVKINYVKGVVYIRFVGSHAEYDAIDADEV